MYAPFLCILLHSMDESGPSLDDISPVDPDFLKYMAKQKINNDPIPLLCNVVSLSTCEEGVTPNQCQCKGCLRSFAHVAPEGWKQFLQVG